MSTHFFIETQAGKRHKCSPGLSEQVFKTLVLKHHYLVLERTEDVFIIREPQSSKSRLK
jgi:hypothetical protein